MKIMQQFITPTDIAALTEDQQNMLWKWANRTKLDRPKGMGINGMPLLSIGRCIEFLIDHDVPMKELMTALVADFQEGKEKELVDILWGAIVIVLETSRLQLQPENLPKIKKIRSGDLITKGTMQQWIQAKQWKQLSDAQMLKMWHWAGKKGNELVFFQIHDVPMLSIGRLLEFLIDHQMILKEIFQDCMKYENREWNKMQLIDVLWEKAKLVLRLPI